MDATFEDEIRMLSRVDILESLSREQLERVAAAASDVCLERDELLCVPQEGAGTVFLLKKGRVGVFEPGVEGRRIKLNVLDEATVFGRLVGDFESARAAYARATEPSLVAVLSQEDLEDLIRACPKVGVQLLRLVSQRISLYQSRLADLAYKGVTGRLASLILYLVESEGVRTREGYRVPTRYTHEQLGEMIGAKRVAVSRAFAHLRETGAIAPGRQIFVTDLDALQSAAEEGSWRTYPGSANRNE